MVKLDVEKNLKFLEEKLTELQSAKKKYWEGERDQERYDAISQEILSVEKSIKYFKNLITINA